MSSSFRLTLQAICRRFLRDETGGVLVYGAFFSILAVGVGAFALDTGRMTLLRSQMQVRADAGALAGAAQLDGKDGAQSRARAVAVEAMTDYSTLPGNGKELSVQAVNFYSALSPSPVAATGDGDSKFAEVVLAPKQVKTLFEPLLALASGAPASATLHARGVATPNPFICHAPPLMLCDPGESDPSKSLDDPANIGRQMQLKPPPGGCAWAPGNYGLLALPDGSRGAVDIERALAAVEPADCYSLDVTTATGVKTNKVQNGVNARFGLGGWPYPAPNVINYPKDSDIASGYATVMGNANWGLTDYWLAKHGASVPADLAGASRYQVYLYEQGLAFARNGRRTIYPVTGDLPSGFTMVTPSGPSIPKNTAAPNDPDQDGEPTGTVASNGQARRLVQVAILSCGAEGVHGSHTYPTNGRYVEMFVTEAVDEEPAGGIYGEIVRVLNSNNHPDFHANVRLVQ